MLCRGKEAILTKLKAAGVEDPSEYITFHGLRTHSVLNGELVSSHHSLQHYDWLTVENSFQRCCFFLFNI
jgi:hypothetical protein